jgi:hypothetical protein
MKYVASALVVYVIAYFALLKPEESWFLACFSLQQPYQRMPEFRVGGERAKTFFSPLLWSDQRARPNYWSGVLLDGRRMSVEEANRIEDAQVRAFIGATSSEPSESASAERAECGSR